MSDAMHAHIQLSEAAMIRALAKRHLGGESVIVNESLLSLTTELGLPAEDFARAARALEAVGLLRKVSTLVNGDIGYFEVDGGVIQAARHIDDAETKAAAPKDIVEQVTAAVRSYPWAAWPIIAFIGLGAILGVFNQIVQALKNLSLVK